MEIELTNYGFTWGPMTVTRMFDDPKYGCYMEIKTAKGIHHIRVTPSGVVMANKQPEGAGNTVSVTTRVK